MKGKDIGYYRSLPYTRFAEVDYDETGVPRWVAHIRELPDCHAEGASYTEALAMLDAVFAEFIESSLASGVKIGEPEVAR